MKLQPQLQAVMAESQPRQRRKRKLSKTTEADYIEVDGTYIDRPWFGGQFVESIEKTGLASVKKFLYLR